MLVQARCEYEVIHQYVTGMETARYQVRGEMGMRREFEEKDKAGSRGTKSKLVKVT